jgi:ribA/ribD-fused uncharacterized protein
MIAIDRFVGENSFLSNFSPAVVKYWDHFYPTVEHGYQAAKSMSISFRRPLMYPSELTAGQAKRYGAKLELRSDWEDIKLLVMKGLLEQKFEMRGYKEKILATGNVELIEGNDWGDMFWGQVEGVGENHLGKILMEVRDSLR